MGSKRSRDLACALASNLRGAPVMYLPRALRALFLGVLVTSCAMSDPTVGDDDEGDTSSLTSDDEAPPDDDGLTPTIEAAKPRDLEVFFAVPTAAGVGDPTLENKILELIAGAPKGSRIRIALYHWTRTSVAKAIVAASKRGVAIEIVLDRQENETARLAPGAADPENADDDVDDEDVDVDPDDALADGVSSKALGAAVKILQDGLPAGSITFCTRGAGSCQGNHINHSKIFMFSTTGSAKQVVVQSSANLTSFKLHNNLVIVRNDAALYKGYLSYFNSLKARHLNLDYYRSKPGDHNVIAYFFPRAQGDTIMSVLDKVKCTSNSKIRVAMAFFTDGRKAVATKLGQLQHAGCDVRVVMRKAGPSSSANMIKILKDAHVKVGLFPTNHGTNIHSKYLLIDSAYLTGSKHPHRKLVYTGSHNYTGGALRSNDEQLLRVDDATVFDAFARNWDAIRAQIP